MSTPATLREDRIYGLPTDWVNVAGETVDLSIVPPGPSGPEDSDLPEKTVNWLQWGIELMLFRKKRIMETEGMVDGVDPNRERAIEILRCRRDPAYFVAVWCHTYEYRPEELTNYPWYNDRFQGWLPFIPMPYQVAMIRWFDRRFESVNNTPNGAVSKSRDMGATEVLTKWGLHGFLFRSPFHVKFVSRMGDLVDQPGNLDSMMERVASHLIDTPQNMCLPGWMIPEGFSKDRNRKERLITHPTLRNMASGEATTSRTGRGGRASVIFIDEYNFIKDLKAVLAATQNTSRHVIGNSSESVEETDAGITWREAMAAKDPDAVFVIEYWMHFFHDNMWLETMRDRYGDDEHAFLREVLRMAEAGFGGWMYPEARAMQVIEETRNAFIRPTKEEMPYAHGDHSKIYWGIDPGINDKTAIWIVMHDPICGRDTVLYSWEFDNRESAEYIAAVLCGIKYDDAGRWEYKWQNPETQKWEVKYDFYFPPKIQEFMQFLNAIPEPTTIFGDPHGTNDHAGRDDGWFPRMMKFWKAHNPKGNRVYKITVNWNPEGRSYQGRRLAMKAWLPRLDFNGDTRTAARALEALQKSRWDDDTDKPRQNVQKQAKHDQWSDLRTAGEYLAVNLEHITAIEDRKKRDGREGAIGRRGYDKKKTRRSRGSRDTNRERDREPVYQ
jgi:hypothetical protein